MNRWWLAAIVWVCFAAAAGSLVVGLTPPPVRAPRHWRPDRDVGVRLAAAVAVGFVVLGLTFWPVMGLAAGLLVWFRDRVFASGEARQARSRVEAVALWLEAVRDRLQSASQETLELALQAAAERPPQAIQAELGVFARQVRQRTPMPEALLELKASLANRSADQAIAAMLAGLDKTGAAVAGMLDHVVRDARLELAARERVDRMRARFESTTKALLLLTIAVFVMLRVLDGVVTGQLDDFGADAPVGLGTPLGDRRLLDLYRSPSGQVLLLFPAGLWVATLVWLRRLANYRLPPRMLLAGELAEHAAAGVAR